MSNSALSGGRYNIALPSCLKDPFLSWDRDGVESVFRRMEIARHTASEHSVHDQAAAVAWEGFARAALEDPADKDPIHLWALLSIIYPVVNRGEVRVWNGPDLQGAYVQEAYDRASKWLRKQGLIYAPDSDELKHILGPDGRKPRLYLHTLFAALYRNLVRDRREELRALGVLPDEREASNFEEVRILVCLHFYELLRWDLIDWQAHGPISEARKTYLRQLETTVSQFIST